jgi:uncharacterized protein
MTKGLLPKKIDPLKLVEKNSKLEGELPLAEMLRLQDFLMDNSGQVQVNLNFDKVTQGFRAIYGTVSCDLPLRCERCLQPVVYHFNIAVKLSPVFEEAIAKDLSPDFEPLVLTGQPVVLSDMIEEEILLNLPIVAKHEVCPNP